MRLGVNRNLQKIKRLKTKQLRKPKRRQKKLKRQQRKKKRLRRRHEKKLKKRLERKRKKKVQNHLKTQKLLLRLRPRLYPKKTLSNLKNSVKHHQLHQATPSHMSIRRQPISVRQVKITLLEAFGTMKIRPNVKVKRRDNLVLHLKLVELSELRSIMRLVKMIS